MVLDSAKNALGTAKNLNSLIATEKGYIGEVYYKRSWNQAQRAEVDAKVKIMNQAHTEVARSDRTETVATMRAFRGKNQIPAGRDVDHKVDLQLGRGKTEDNLWSLDASVNRSLGAQIHHEIKNLPVGTVIEQFIIRDRINV